MENGKGSSLSEFFKVIGEQSQTCDEIMAEATKGYVSKVRDIFYEHKGHEHLKEDQAHLLVQILKSPQKFPRAAELIFLILDQNFSDNKLLKTASSLNSELEKTIWTVYASAPGEKMAKACGMLAAEYIRYSIVKDGSYQLPLNSIFSFAKELDLNAQDAERKIKESIIAIQNALFDYVSEEGPQLPLNRGAAMLPIFADREGSELWMKKMSDLIISGKYSLQKGDISNFSPQYF